MPLRDPIRRRGRGREGRDEGQRVWISMHKRDIWNLSRITQCAVVSVIRRSPCMAKMKYFISSMFCPVLSSFLICATSIYLCAKWLCDCMVLYTCTSRCSITLVYSLAGQTFCGGNVWPARLVGLYTYCSTVLI